MMRAVHRPQRIGFAHRNAVLVRLLQFHQREHVVRVVGQVSRLAIEVGLGQVGRGHALVARPELHFLGQLLEFLPNDGAVRQP